MEGSLTTFCEIVLGEEGSYCYLNSYIFDMIIHMHNIMVIFIIVTL